MNRQEFFDRVTTPNPTYKRALTEFAEALQDLQVKVDRDLPIQLQATEPDPHYFDGVVDRVSQTASTVAQLLEQPELKGKKIVAVGGAFSAGKSSLINALIGEKRLVAEVDPTTSVPTYVCAGPSERITAINLFQQQIELSAAEFASLTHDEHSQHGSQIGGLLRSVTVQTPNFAWPHLALLDTPGYSKPGEAASSERTDAEIARDQLNAADYILWVVSAAAGAMSADELEFLRGLKPEIPKLLVISRADSKPAEDIAAIQALMAETLKRHQIEVVDVVVTSARKPELYLMEKFKSYLTKWNYFEPSKSQDSTLDLEYVFHSLQGGVVKKKLVKGIIEATAKNYLIFIDLLTNILSFGFLSVRKNLSILAEGKACLVELKTSKYYKDFVDFLNSFDAVDGRVYLKKFLSIRSRLSESSIDKFIETVDIYIDSNKNLPWDIGMINKYEKFLAFKDEIFSTCSYSPPWRWTEELIISCKEKIDYNAFCESHEVPWSESLIYSLKDRLNWSELSANPTFPWDEKLIDSFSTEINWHNISFNRGMKWSLYLIEKYADRIIFENLSANEGVFWTDEILIKFEGKWDWKRISSNSSMPWGESFLRKNFHRICLSNLSWSRGFYWDHDFIEINQDALNWRAISSNISINWTYDFILKFADKIVWDVFSENKSVAWNYDMIKFFKNKIEWKNFCRRAVVPWDLDLLNEFQEEIKWSYLCENSEIVWDIKILKAFKSKLDWSELATLESSNIPVLEDVDARALMKKFGFEKSAMSQIIDLNDSINNILGFL